MEKRVQEHGHQGDLKAPRAETITTNQSKVIESNKNNLLIHNQSGDSVKAVTEEVEGCYANHNEKNRDTGKAFKQPYELFSISKGNQIQQVI